MSVYVYGQDLLERTPKAQMLLRELANVGLKAESVKTLKELTFKEGYVLTFGAVPFKEVTGCEERLTEVRGQMFLCPFNEDLLVFPTWSPGYIYREPTNLPLFRQDLDLFKTVIKLDREGVLT